MGLFALAVSALCAVGIFTRLPDTGPHYLTLPLALLTSLVPAALVSRLLEKSGEGLGGALNRRLRGFAVPAALPLCLALTFTAALPMIEFTKLLRCFVFDGVSALSVIAFIFPVTAYAALVPARALGRTALIVLPLTLLAFAAAILPTAPGFKWDRLLQSVPNGAASEAKYVLRETRLFLPIFAALLIDPRVKRKEKTAARSAVPAAVIIAAVLVSVALIYPAEALARMTVPIARISFLTLKQSYAPRLDKVLIMIWLSGSIASAAFCTGSAGRLLASSSGGKGRVPFTLLFALAAFALTLASQRADGAGETLVRFHENYGALMTAVPMLLASLLSLIRTKNHEEY